MFYLVFLWEIGSFILMFVIFKFFLLLLVIKKILNIFFYHSSLFSLILSFLNEKTTPANSYFSFILRIEFRIIIRGHHQKMSILEYSGRQSTGNCTRYSILDQYPISLSLKTSENVFRGYRKETLG